MGNPTSIVEELFDALPTLRAQMYFKTSLTALSHAMEDQVLAGAQTQPLIIASFQQERFYRQEAHRYERIGGLSDQVYVLSAADTKFSESVDSYEKIAFDEEDALCQEWHLVVLSEHYCAALICREHQGNVEPPLPNAIADSAALHLDQTRRFEGIWTLDRQVSLRAADLLLGRIQAYRPALADKINEARSRLMTGVLGSDLEVETDPFAQRLITYLQASQYKQLKAYRAIALQEQRERLVNSITSAIRRSLDPSEIFAIAVQELGKVLNVGRCIIYRCTDSDADATIQHEYRQGDLTSLAGSTWPLKHNPIYQWVKSHQSTLAIGDVNGNRESTAGIDLASLMQRLQRWQIQGCLLVPLVHQNRLLGMIELHLSEPDPHHWNDDEIMLTEAIANQLSVALIQAEAYAHLGELNQQLAALERTRSNLIAITGHELRTPLSTIRVCLESLLTEPDMDADMRQIMLDTALTDAERMRKLVQDFLTLSRLESGRVEWNLESLALQECVDLALSSLRWQNSAHAAPSMRIETNLSDKLPFVRADGEWIVEVLSKLLDNACKFTEANGQITISAQVLNKKTIEVTVADTGRGIEADRLETVFERFYQEEGALRRSVGGTGLGLAICQQIIQGLGGNIWATSAGKNQGSQIHFTLPSAGKATHYSNRQSRSPQAASPADTSTSRIKASRSKATKSGKSRPRA
ncbi:MAG: histidine kinase [Phormidesmis priestleyi]|uniref:histidine kinase n=1 Tax=Phormidesmis priestleyi TaxID=268141 RepID=A0A2W4WL86_9CYAN|nr:MAG: histidine kinase [Phormidesmis priestleyi]